LGLQPCRDETNEHPTTTRNRIRLRVLPELEATNPGIAEALSRLAAASAQDADYLGDVANETFKQLAVIAAQRVSLSRKDLLTLPSAIATRVIRAAIKQVTGTSNDIERIHVAAVLALAGRKPGQLSLTNAVSVQSDSRCIHFYHGAPTVSSRIPESILSVPGITHAGHWTIQCELVADPGAPDPSATFEAYLKRARPPTTLMIRSRRPGDRLHPMGLGGEKKVQDVFVDAKVPANERDGVPLICDEGGILWIVGHRIDRRAAVSEGAGELLHIIVQRKI